MCASPLFLLASAALAPGALTNPSSPTHPAEPYRPLFVPMTGNNGYPFHLTSLNPQLRVIDEPTENMFTFDWVESEAEEQEYRLQFPAGATVVSDKFWISEPTEGYNPLPDPREGWQVDDWVKAPADPNPPPAEQQGLDHLFIIADGVVFRMRAFSIRPSFIYTPTPKGPVVTLNILSEEEAAKQGVTGKGLNPAFEFYIGSGQDIDTTGAQFLDR